MIYIVNKLHIIVIILIKIYKIFIKLLFSNNFLYSDNNIGVEGA